MEMTFNPDPALQAEAMITEFQFAIKLDTHSPASIREFIIHIGNAKACALIAARMCKDTAIKLREYREPWFMGENEKIEIVHPKAVECAYWSAVIEHLEKK